ncbi:tRNA-splicing ligase RtcB [Bryocella elongata]|uniref:3'-phosphate/5'-hydroxy nucleic acid ligase n=1 Tax=Bryocella elongata TaxID=863522 RepID=A0A1H6AAQ5_9BACT|nr:RtcB family protein [Bryocella elongata]SEG45839.1 tRNA-splicing ligase RtcB [Bryocella elongata]
MKMIDEIPVFGEHEANTLEQARMCARHADRFALMADGHLGYGVPIGGVIASESRISPTAVGFDIACGNKAVRLDMPGGELRANIHRLMEEIFRTLSFGVGRKNAERVEHKLFAYDESMGNAHDGWNTEAAKPLKRKAEAQLGTIGSGNHYVDLFTDEQDRVWVGVHFGSRGLGHGIATWFLKAAGAKDGMMVDPVFLDVESDLGAQYIAAMQLGGAYAYAGRDWVCERVARLLGAPVMEEVHNHHNFAWLEEHEGRKLWVCRKGATPAFPGQRGFVGGTMGEQSVILEGVAPDESTEEGRIVAASQRASLYSTVHGAGRVMGRKQAAGVYDRKTGACKREGLVKPEMMHEWMTRSNVVLKGGGLDESPHCYKRLNEVLASHAGTIRVLHTLTPVGVAMAGANEFDPYKD